MRRIQKTGVILAAGVLLLSACSGASKDDASAVKTADGSGEIASPSADTVAPAADAPAGEAPGAGEVTPTTGAASASGASRPSGGSGTNTAPPAAAPTVSGNKPDPQLFTGSLNTRGITDTQITICGHAALTYGPAFNATPDDFNVYYSAINDAGGVHGRKIVATYENDNYEPGTAVQAAEACKAKNPAMILGGIGFDQIPAVRNWSESNKELYFHHIATEVGAKGKLYSYTTFPSVERVGTAFGQLAAKRIASKKIGVLYRNSEFWAPGFNAFKEEAKRHNLNIVLSVPVEKNQGNYTQGLTALKNAGAEVVFGWENTLALTQMVKQAKAQNWSPVWMAFPFNLTSQTLADEAMTPPMFGLAAWPGYSKGDYSGTFASYADDMKLFEQQYAKYRPNTDIGGVAGDLLWMTWIEQKRLVELLKACGRACTRNHIVGLLANGFKATVSPTCPLDFSGGRHNGSGDYVNVLETYRSPGGKVNWRSTALCRTNNF